MAWAPLLPASRLAEALEQHFFPKFLRVLAQWLAADPDYAELLAWYRGWTAQFPASLRGHPAVAFQFSIALRLLDRALDEPGSTPDVALATEASARLRDHQAATAAARSQATAAAEAARSASIPAAAAAMGNELNMRDVVQMMAEHNGVHFAPKSTRTADGKMLYAFGAHTIYIDNNVVFAKSRKDPARFEPIALEDLNKA